MTRGRGQSGRRGFSLVELVVSMAILGVVVLACGSAMMLGARAASNGLGDSSLSGRVIQGRMALDQIVSDLEVATAIKEQTLTAITVTVPDRDGNATEETIRYSWSGVPGEDLYREYNGTKVVFAPGVSRFSLDHLLRVAVAGGTGGGTASILGGSQVDSGGVLSEYKITSTAWFAQYVKPTLPRGTTTWSVSSVKLYMKRSGMISGVLKVGVHAADGLGKPTGAALATGTFDTNALGVTPEWIQVGVSVSGLNPANGVVFVFSTTDNDAGYVHYHSPASDPDMKYCTSANSGSSWSVPVSTSVLEFTMYGGYGG